MSYSIHLLTHNSYKLPTLIQLFNLSCNHHFIPQFSLCLCVFIFRPAFARCSSQACFFPSYPVSCVTKRTALIKDVAWDHWTPCLLIMIILVTQSRVTWNRKRDSGQPCLTPCSRAQWCGPQAPVVQILGRTILLIHVDHYPADKCSGNQ